MATFIHRACTNTNLIIGRRCDPVDTIVQPDRTGPPAPTDINITPGPGTLTITWKHGDGTPTATSWKIGAYRVGTQGIAADPDNDDTAIEADPATGHTITGLAFDTDYLIRIQGTANNHTGATATAADKTLLAAVRLVALEITQGLQNWQGDMDLVKGKRTVVRAFLEPVDGTRTEVRAKLYAVLSDGTGYGPLYPVNATGRSSDVKEHTFVTRRGVAGRRHQLDASVNFLVDGPPKDASWEREDWIGDPSQVLVITPHGIPALAPPYVVTYRLEVEEGVLCEEAIDSHVECSAELHFVSVKTPRVRMVGIRTRDPSGTPPEELEPTGADLVEQAERIASLMPIPELQYELRSYNRIVEPPPAGLAPLLLELLAARSNDGDTSAYLGVMLGSTGGGRAGSIPSNVAVWYTSGTEATGSTGPARNRGSHEFGHIIGERHAAYEDMLDEDNDPDTLMLTICSGIDTLELGSAGDDAVPFPYIDVLRNAATRWPAPTAAFLGPMTGLESDDSKIWGFDTRFVDGPPARLAVVDPAEVDSVMSYCRGVPGSQRRWVDAFYHRRFMDAVNTINWSLGPDPGSSGNPAANPLAAFFGYVTSAADGTVAEVKVLPVFTFTPTAPAATTPAGDYRLELLDSGGEVLRSVSFDAQPALADVGGRGEEPASLELWAVHVADPPDYASYRIWRGSRQIVQVERSNTAPTVAIASPEPGGQ